MKLRILSQIPPLPAAEALRVALLLCLSIVAHPTYAAVADYFRITVQDAKTGRGVPLHDLDADPENVPDRLEAAAKPSGKCTGSRRKGYFAP